MLRNEKKASILKVTKSNFSSLHFVLLSIGTCLKSLILNKTKPLLIFWSKNILYTRLELSDENWTHFQFHAVFDKIC